jgi:TolB-like protein
MKQPAIRSLAVLPLQNLSDDPTQQYLADGITEELIGRLAGIRQLRSDGRASEQLTWEGVDKLS